jgi:hypothetical protein
MTVGQTQARGNKNLEGCFRKKGQRVAEYAFSKVQLLIDRGLAAILAGFRPANSSLTPPAKMCYRSIEVDPQRG